MPLFHVAFGILRKRRFLASVANGLVAEPPASRPDKFKSKQEASDAIWQPWLDCQFASHSTRVTRLESYLYGTELCPILAVDEKDAVQCSCIMLSSVGTSTHCGCGSGLLRATLRLVLVPHLGIRPGLTRKAPCRTGRCQPTCIPPFWGGKKGRRRGGEGRETCCDRRTLPM